MIIKFADRLDRFLFGEKIIITTYYPLTESTNVRFVPLKPRPQGGFGVVENVFTPDAK